MTDQTISQMKHFFIDTIYQSNPTDLHLLKTAFFLSVLNIIKIICFHCTKTIKQSLNILVDILNT